MNLQLNYFTEKKQSTTKVYTWRPHALAKDHYWPRVYWGALLLLVAMSIYFLYDLFVEGYAPKQLLVLPAVYLAIRIFYLLTFKIIIEQESEMISVSYYIFGRLRKRRKTYLRDDINGFYFKKAHLLIYRTNKEYESLMQSNDHSFKFELNYERFVMFVDILNDNWKLNPNEIVTDEIHIPQKLEYDDFEVDYVLKKHNLLDHEQSFYIGTPLTWRQIVSILVQSGFITLLLISGLFFPFRSVSPPILGAIVIYTMLIVFSFFALWGIYIFIMISSRTIILFQEHQRLRVKTILFYGLFSRNKYISKEELDAVYLDEELGLMAAITNEQAKTSTVLISKKINVAPNDLSYIKEQLNAFWETKENQ